MADSLAPKSLVAYEAYEPDEGAWESVQQALGQVSRCPPGPLAFGYESVRASPLVDGARGVSHEDRKQARRGSRGFCS